MRPGVRVDADALIDHRRRFADIPRYAYQPTSQGWCRVGVGSRLPGWVSRGHRTAPVHCLRYALGFEERQHARRPGRIAGTEPLLVSHCGGSVG